MDDKTDKEINENVKINRINKKPKKKTTRLPAEPNTHKTHKIIDMAKEKDDLLRHDK